MVSGADEVFELFRIADEGEEVVDDAGAAEGAEELFGLGLAVDDLLHAAVHFREDDFIDLEAEVGGAAGVRPVDGGQEHDGADDEGGDAEAAADDPREGEFFRAAPFPFGGKSVAAACGALLEGDFGCFDFFGGFDLVFGFEAEDGAVDFLDFEFGGSVGRGWGGVVIGFGSDEGAFGGFDADADFFRLAGGFLFCESFGAFWGEDGGGAAYPGMEGESVVPRIVRSDFRNVVVRVLLVRFHQ